LASIIEYNSFTNLKMIFLTLAGVKISHAVGIVGVVGIVIAAVVPKARTVYQSCTAPPPLIVAWEDLTTLQRDELQTRLEYDSQSLWSSKEVLRPLLEDYKELRITLADVESFHPVVVFPQVRKKNQYYPYYQVLNLTTASPKDNFIAVGPEVMENEYCAALNAYAVGKYNELRRNLYDEEVFRNTDHQIQGYSGARIIHVGIDLGGPVGTPVYAFSDGKVLHAGYNPSRGDYGNVIVVEHHWTVKKELQVLWALYGHLSNSTIGQSPVGKVLHRGQILGWIGDVHENGGWLHPHVHFQLSITPPITHDLPGVVSMADRDRALRQYPDPRIILGMLYR
jgi:murein DD-endopeptidase MepM/ murein hydrolase activator NlpD